MIKMLLLIFVLGFLYSFPVIFLLVTLLLDFAVIGFGGPTPVLWVILVALHVLLFASFFGNDAAKGG